MILAHDQRGKVHSREENRRFLWQFSPAGKRFADEYRRVMILLLSDKAKTDK
jgi:hypothetical protein